MKRINIKPEAASPSRCGVLYTHAAAPLFAKREEIKQNERGEANERGDNEKNKEKTRLAVRAHRFGYFPRDHLHGNAHDDAFGTQ